MLPSPMRLQKGRFVARFAESEADVQAAQRLRFLVFRAGSGEPDSLDVDRFDKFSQHVLVEDIESDALVCCFRMMTFDTGAEASNGYAAQFYNVKPLADFPGPLVEVGRFCVADGAHDADILRVAWGAVTRHVDECDAKLLFGCSSLKGVCTKVHADTLTLLKDRYLAPPLWAPAEKASEVYCFAEDLADQIPNQRAALRGMPPLLRTYLAMGGWVSDHAVIDRDLGTMHVFTGVEIASIPPARAKALRAIAD